jgi:hypothetical protein
MNKAETIMIITISFIPKIVKLKKINIPVAIKNNPRNKILIIEIKHFIRI